MQSLTHRYEMPIALWGFVISFVGSLPPGTTNILTIQLSATRGYEASAWFSAGCMIAELLCVSICIVVMDRIRQSKILIKSMEWASLLIITWLVVSSFATVKDPTPLDIPLMPHNASPFLFGILLMAVNPVQIPFWFGWTTILIERRLIKAGTSDSVWYVTGIALGSAAASALFITCGQMISDWVSGRETLLQWMFGLFFLSVGAAQVFKIVKNRREKVL